jgi:hypothetical protein
MLTALDLSAQLYKYDEPLSNRAFNLNLRRYSKDVKPGESRVMACLEAHSSDAKFSGDCRAIIDRRAVVPHTASTLQFTRLM